MRSDTYLLFKCIELSLECLGTFSFMLHLNVTNEKINVTYRKIQIEKCLYLCLCKFTDFKESDEKQNAKIYSNLIGFFCLVICCA